MNFGERIANRQLQKVGRKLRASYRTAQKELEETLADFNKRFKEKDRQKRALKAAGKISEQEYKNWLSGQVFIRGQWEKKLKSVCRVLHEYNVQAGKMIHEGKIDVFAENYNYSAFVAEQKTGISFDIYNTEAVTRLIKDEPQVLPEWKVDEEKDYKWNRKKVQNAVTQGIIQGDSIEDITARLCRDLVTTNENKMRLFARTAMTGAQNAGRQKHMEQAAKKGIRQNKRWVATLDSRTRDAHRELDGQEVPYDKPFKIDGEEIMFPGDPSAPPALSYNCRCRHVTIYPDYEDYSKHDWREDEIIDGQSYEEWKKGKTKDSKTIPASGVVEGKDITETWERRPDQFDFEIEDVINAQGFDGLPRVVSQKEFDKLVKENSFIAQRTYSAENRETLEMYRQQLYEGKFYVECSGGARIGNGMYCAANYDGVLTSEIKAEMLSYSSLGESRFEKDIDRIKINELRNQRAEKAGEKILANGGSNQQAYSAFQKIREISDEEYAKQYAPELLSKKGVSFVETFTFQKGAKIIDYHDLYAMKEELVNSLPLSERHKYRKMDLGSFATLKGYDAIVDGTSRTADTVILNRTKCVFLGGKK